MSNMMKLTPLLIFLAASFAPLSAGKPIQATFANKNRIKPWASPEKGANVHVASLAAIRDVRGGACSDSDPVLFLKVATSALVETGALLAVLAGGDYISSKLDTKSIGGLSILQWLSGVAVIFFSSFFGSVVDGGLSAATNQVLDPNSLPGDPDWYANLVKPSWNPPGWVFPIMWLIVSKPTQLLALKLILQGDGDKPWNALAVYCGHLALGDAWNKVFFGLQCTGRGAFVITVFYAMLLTSTALFWSIDETAGKFMLPTCGWVSVATALNWNIYLNN